MKYIVGISAIFLFVILGYIYYIQRNSVQREQSAVSGNEVAINDVNKLRYLMYSQDMMDTYSRSKRVLFFYASWCPTCQPVDRELSEKADTIPSDTIIVRVNYNDPDTDADEKALAEQYAITYQHTFVILDEAGTVRDTWNGGDVDEIFKRLNNI